MHEAEEALLHACIKAALIMPMGAYLHYADAQTDTIQEGEHISEWIGKGMLCSCAGAGAHSGMPA